MFEFYRKLLEGKMASVEKLQRSRFLNG